MQKFTIEKLFGCGLADVNHLEKLMNDYRIDINEVIDFVKDIANDSEDKNYIININNYYYAFYYILATKMAQFFNHIRGFADSVRTILNEGFDSIKTNCIASCFDNEKMQELQQEYLSIQLYNNKIEKQKLRREKIFSN